MPPPLTDMTERELLIWLAATQQQISDDVKALTDTVARSSDDHNKRLLRLERFADRALLIGGLVASAGGTMGWVISQIPQWMMALRH